MRSLPNMLPNIHQIFPSLWSWRLNFKRFIRRKRHGSILNKAATYTFQRRLFTFNLFLFALIRRLVFISRRFMYVFTILSCRNLAISKNQVVVVTKAAANNAANWNVRWRVPVLEYQGIPRSLWLVFQDLGGTKLDSHFLVRKVPKSAIYWTLFLLKFEIFFLINLLWLLRVREAPLFFSIKLLHFLHFLSDIISSLLLLKH